MSSCLCGWSSTEFAQDAGALQALLNRYTEELRKAPGPDQRDDATRAALVEVQKLLETVKDEETAARARAVAGDFCAALEDYAGASAHFRKFLETWPNHTKAADLRMNLGHVLLAGGQDGPAREAFQELIRRHPTDPRIFEARIRIAQTYVTEKKEEEALKGLSALREEFKGKPEEWIAAMQQAAVLQIAGRAAEARALLEEIVRDSPQRNAAEFAKDVLYKWLWLGKPAPAIEGKDLAGSAFGPSEHRGKVVVLYFFSSRVKEFAVEAFVLRRLIRSVPATDLAVLGVAIDPDRSKLEADLKQVRVTWPVLHDGKELEGPAATLYRLKTVPLLLVIDRKGVIRAVNPLFSEHGRELVRCVEKLAAEK